MLSHYKGKIPSKTPCASCGRRINPLSEAVVSQNGLWFCNTVEMMEYSRPIVPRFDKAPLPWTEKISMGVVITVMVGLLVFLWALPSRGQGWQSETVDHEDHSFMNGNNGSCCDQGDLRLIRLSEDWKMEKGQYWVHLFGSWIPVPDYATHLNHRLPESVTQGRAAIWFRVENAREGGEPATRVNIFCFQPGSTA